jgi:hypothetical protein
MYERRQPEATLLYQTVQTHWRQFLADIEADGGEAPAFVRDEFEAYFRCGILAHGFFCTFGVRTADKVASLDFPANVAGSARAAWAAEWPTPRHFARTTFSRKSPSASSCARCRSGLDFEWPARLR